MRPRCVALIKRRRANSTRQPIPRTWAHLYKAEQEHTQAQGEARAEVEADANNAEANWPVLWQYAAQWVFETRGGPWGW
jgi:hypothetical protein